MPRRAMAALSLSLANAACDSFPAARMCPEETVVFLHSQLSGGSVAGRVAALGLLGALAHSDGQCHGPGTQGRGWGCWAESRNGLKVVHLHPKGAAKSGSPSRADAPRQGSSSPPAARNGGTPGTMIQAQQHGQAGGCTVGWCAEQLLVPMPFLSSSVLPYNHGFQSL